MDPAHTPDWIAFVVVRHYEIRVPERISRDLAAALGPVAARYEPPVTVLVGALHQRHLYALLQRLLVDVPLLVPDVRVVGAPAPAPANSSLDGAAPAPYVVEFAGLTATEVLTDRFRVAVAHRNDRTLVSGRFDASALAGCSATRASAVSTSSDCVAQPSPEPCCHERKSRLLLIGRARRRVVFTQRSGWCARRARR
jgi:hypothetical protein